MEYIFYGVIINGRKLRRLFIFSLIHHFRNFRLFCYIKKCLYDSTNIHIQRMSRFVVFVKTIAINITEFHNVYLSELKCLSVYVEFMTFFNVVEI